MMKTLKNALNILAVLLIPGSIFWILWRYGFTKIIDVFAIAIVLAGLTLLVFRYLFKQKIISFKK